jgi:hypothetical protein
MHKVVEVEVNLLLTSSFVAVEDLPGCFRVN